MIAPVPLHCFSITLFRTLDEKVYNKKKQNVLNQSNMRIVSTLLKQVSIQITNIKVQMPSLFKRRIFAVVIQLCFSLLGGDEHTVLKFEINDSNQDIQNLFHVNFNDLSVVTPR